MAYITADEYKNMLGEPPEDFEKLNFFASAAIDRETLYQLSGRDIALMPAPMQDAIKQAAALEIQALDEAGGTATLSSGAPDSASIGAYSYSGMNAGNKAFGVAMTSPRAQVIMPVIWAMIRGIEW